MKYNCIIVDDNIIERDALRMHLDKIATLNIIAECDSANEAIMAANRQPVDIVFSDVQMPGMNGFDLSKSFRVAPVFIFITSYSEHAIESFNVDAIDFVLKPASFDRLLKATNKAIEYLELKRSFNNNRDILPTLPGENIISKTADVDDYFFIKESVGHTRLHYADVVYIESMGDFSKIYTTQNTKHIILVSLKNFENQLPTEIFKRVHKQFIINVWQIATITATEIILNNKQQIPLSNNFRQQLMDTVVSKKLLSRS